jgi:tripartite-type tricarboxylate transporter receptor subunit TctC
VPVALLFNISYTLVAPNSLPYRSVQEIMAAARRAGQPERGDVGNAAASTSSARCSRSSPARSSSRFYRGSAAAFPTSLQGASICSSIPRRPRCPTSSRARSRLAVLAASRHPQMPDVPTMTEAG